MREEYTKEEIQRAREQAQEGEIDWKAEYADLRQEYITLKAIAIIFGIVAILLLFGISALIYRLS